MTSQSQQFHLIFRKVKSNNAAWSLLVHLFIMDCKRVFWALKFKILYICYAIYVAICSVRVEIIFSRNKHWLQIVYIAPWMLRWFDLLSKHNFVKIRSLVFSEILWKIVANDTKVYIYTLQQQCFQETL